MKNMKVSAIIPTYNRPDTSLRALKSIMAQTHNCDEIIVVNDCSTDHTLQSLEKFKSEHPSYNIHILNLQENKGVSAARNHGIKAASNPWLAFLDSDDEWEPTKLAKQLQSLKASKCFISHTQERWVRNGKLVNQKKKHQKFGGDVYEKCLDMCFIGPSTSIIHKSVFDDVGLFDEKFIVCEDYDLWLRITYKYTIDYLDEVLLTKHGGHEDQLSTTYKAMDYWRAFALKKQINNRSLNDRLKTITQLKLDEKIKILKAGALKHQNKNMLEKIKSTLA